LTLFSLLDQNGRTDDPDDSALDEVPRVAGPAPCLRPSLSTDNGFSVTYALADGAQTQHLGQHTFPVIRWLMNDIVTVSDAELVAAMKFFALRMKIVAEPTGCLAAAAVFEKKIDVRDRKVGVLISGGNVDLSRFAELVQDH